VIVFSILALLALAGVITLIPLGLRAGDRPGEVLLLDVEPRIAPRGATVTVTNPRPSWWPWSASPNGCGRSTGLSCWLRLRARAA
jgi:hypothetical protein